MTRQPLAVALVHYPVVDRNRSVITTAVTNLDLHDIARTSRTYGAERFYVVTPVVEQQRLVERILGHWCRGYGADYNPSRKDALELIEVTSTLDEALEKWRIRTSAHVRPLLTGASRHEGLSYREARRMMGDESLFLTFGTGWGLAPELFDQGWQVLEAIRGPGEFNHLPVRAAVAAILDRLAGLDR